MFACMTCKHFLIALPGKLNGKTRLIEYMILCSFEIKISKSDLVIAY